MIIAKIWMMQVVDQPALKLRSLLTSHNWRRLGGEAAASTFAKAISKSPAPSLLLSGEEASQYLQQLIPEVERQIATEHSRYGCVRWLWYLRRIPKEFFGGSYSTTFAYDRVLSESLTGSWPEPSTPVGSLLHFPVDDSAARQIARFLGRVKLLSHLHTVYRRIGKGAELDLGGSIAFANTPEAIESAIRLYDERHDQGYNFCAPGLGIATLTSAPERMDDVFELNGNSLLVSFAIAEPVRVNAPFPKGPEIVDAELDSWHALRVMPLQKVFDPFSDADSDPLPYLSLLAAVIQLLILLPAFLGRFVGAFAGTLQHGYFLLPERKLEELISEALADINVTLKERCPRVNWPADYGAWLSQLNQVQPQTWPLRPGGLLRRINQHLLIDVTCASNLLISRIEIGRSPRSGNVRAAAFELQCQQVINDSRWRPDQRLLELRGRTLQKGGKNLTDIDAVGASRGTLLLVSCKSIIYDAAYDKGEYRVVRNVQATVDEAVQHWADFIGELRRTPHGDNFDFSAFEQIIGVVCTPFVAYTSYPASLAFVAPNLRASVSSAELANWLAS